MKDLRNIFSNAEYQQLGVNFTNKYLSKKNNENLQRITQKKKPEFGGEWSSTLKPILCSLSEHRCNYCERKISHCDSNAAVVEHYRPKAHYWWLAYDYENYTLACSTCNIAKSDNFQLFDNQQNVKYENRNEIDSEKPLFVNPFFEKPYKYFELIFSNYSGSRKYNVIKLSINPTLTDNYEIEKSKKTIEVFNLDLHKKEEKYRSEQIIDFEDFCKKLLPYAEKLDFHKKKLLQAWKNRTEAPETLMQAEKEYKDYLEKLRSEQSDEIINTGYWQLIVLEQYRIIKST